MKTLKIVHIKKKKILFKVECTSQSERLHNVENVRLEEKDS